MIKEGIFKIYKKNVIKKHKLDYLFWECTLRCNLSCLHCGSDCLKQSGIADMPVSDFAKALDNIKAGGIKDLTVCITGGEPLMRSDLEEAGRQIIKRGYRWGIVSNALALTADRFNSLLNAGLSSISFSLDGLEEKHNYMRQNPNSFETVNKAIKMAVYVQKNYPGKLVFDVITCASKHNLEILPQIRTLLIEKGVTQWRVFSIFPQGRAAKSDLGLSSEEYKKLMLFIEETRTKYGDKIHLNYACEGYLGQYELKVRDYFFFCRGGINIGSIWTDGSVSACLSVRGKDFIQGNLYQNNFDFMDLWNNKFKNHRDRSWAKIGKCKNCKMWSKCMGNGLHLHNDANSEPAYCNYEMLK